jgi:hypothetical protein
MLIFLVAIGVALGVRVLFSPRRLATGRVRWAWIPVGAAVLQVGLNVHRLRAVVGSHRFELVVLSYIAVGLWLVGNAWIQEQPLRGVALLIPLGWTLNVIPIVANRGMPVSRWALTTIGGSSANVGDGNLWKHVIATPHTVIPWLGDVIPIPLPGLRNVISLGDLVMVAGVVGVIQFVRFGTVHQDHMKRKDPAIVFRD